MQLHYTMLDSVRATKKKDYCTDFETFIDNLRNIPRTKEKIKSHMIFPGQLGERKNNSGSYRTEDNVVQISFLAVDHDSGLTQLSEVVGRLEKAGILAFGHSTHSAGSLINATTTAARWRLYTPLDTNIPKGGQSTLETTLKCFLVACGLEGDEFWNTFLESKKTLSSHSMFVLPPNCFEAGVTDGEPIDIDQWLPLIPQAPQPRRTQNAPQLHTACSTSFDMPNYGLEAGNRNSGLVQLLGAFLARNPKAQGWELRAFAHGINQSAVQPPLPVSEVEHIIKSAGKWVGQGVDGPADTSSEEKTTFESFSIRGKNQARKERTLSEVFVLPKIALQGQATVIYAKPNTGKTLLTLHMLITAIEAGNISPDDVFYINADDTYNGSIIKGDLSDQYGFHMLVPGEEGFTEKHLARLMMYAVDEDNASGKIIVLDTLKKFTDLMDKSVGSKFMHLVRMFVAKGGTVIMLAHVNKHKGADGKAVHGGTSDVIDDSDCAYILDEVEVDEHGTRLVKFENSKKRGQVAETVFYAYDKNEHDYVALLDTVRERDDLDKSYKGVKINDAEVEIINCIEAYLWEAQEALQKDIVAHVMDTTGLGKRKIITVLHSNVKWATKQGQKNHKVYVPTSTF